MKKAILFGIVLVVAFLVIGGVSAFQYGKQNQSNSVDKESAETAIESGDYDAWKALHEGQNGKMAQLITEANFYLLKEMHEARDAGNFDRVKEIKAELGLTGKGYGQQNGKGLHKGFGQGQNNGNCPMA
jgi:hypothetical protein